MGDNNEKELIYVTLDNGKRYQLVDETIQNGIKYYLASEVDEEDTPLMNSSIFEELKEGEDTYYLPVVEEEILNSLTAIFLANYNKFVDEEL